uniref:Uncharacterized protein n=1 Tax=Rhodosorus marinus TaxID=101924 RepID=A0A7S3EKF9_9RHOD|mmetsp:Transcript_40688/g.161294  ORF Transcript_40688/g.161294 Transcript_40688/m.161294 type:complete len:293 (+) Transcript_40688:353-1231(+)
MGFGVFRSGLLHGVFARGGYQGVDRSTSRLRRLSTTKASDCVFIASDCDALAGKNGESLSQNESDLVGPAAASGPEARLLQRASHHLSLDRITGAAGAHRGALVRFEQFDDELSRLSHRPLNVFLRPRMDDRVQAYGDLIREGVLPGVIQGAGVIMTIAVPIHYMLQDFRNGWMCPKHDDENVDTVFCGPVYDMRIHGYVHEQLRLGMVAPAYCCCNHSGFHEKIRRSSWANESFSVPLCCGRDSTMSEILYRERAYLSLMIYSPTMQMPTSFRFPFSKACSSYPGSTGSPS